MEIKSKYLHFLDGNFFDRDDFIDAFREYFSKEEQVELESMCQGCKCLDEFLLYYKEDEFYIIHLESGTIINWYKHLGRANTCNKLGFAYEDLKEMLKLLKEDFDSHKDDGLKGWKIHFEI